MQKLSYSKPTGDFYTSWNLNRHACPSKAQQNVMNALEIIATGDAEAISAAAHGGKLCGCRVRRPENEELGELARGRSEYCMRRVIDHHVNPKTGRWKTYSWVPQYNDADMEHWEDYFDSCCIVITCTTVNRRGKYKDAWAHVCYDDPRDAQELLCIITGEPMPETVHDPHAAAPDAPEPELVPLDCYGWASEPEPELAYA